MAPIEIKHGINYHLAGAAPIGDALLRTCLRFSDPPVPVYPYTNRDGGTGLTAFVYTKRKICGSRRWHTDPEAGALTALMVEVEREGKAAMEPFKAHVRKMRVDVVSIRDQTDSSVRRYWAALRVYVLLTEEAFGMPPVALMGT